MIASLSSKSAKRFLVNFQIKNEMMPMTATPPATERPIMEPVPRPLEPLLVEEDSVLDGLALDVGVMTIVLVTSCPAELVVTCTDVVNGSGAVVGVVAVVWEGGVEVVWEVVVGEVGGGVVVVWVGEVVGDVGVVVGVDVVCGVVVVGVVVGGVVVGVVVVTPTGGADKVSWRI